MTQSRWPRNTAEPANQHLVDDWLRRAYTRAGVEKKPGGLWHPLRRKFATERKGHSIADLSAAGGWRDSRTLLASYLQSDAESVRVVIMQPTHRIWTAVQVQRLLARLERSTA